MIPITLFEKSGTSAFIRSIKVFYMYMTTHSSKFYELRNIKFIRRMTWNIAILERKIYNIKIKVIGFIINLEETKPLEIERCKKGGLGF